MTSPVCKHCGQIIRETKLPLHHYIALAHEAIAEGLPRGAVLDRLTRSGASHDIARIAYSNAAASRLKHEHPGRRTTTR